MSLDKFIMRGFTGSTGSSTGQWVSSSLDSHKEQNFQPNRDTGSSFVLGGGGSSGRSKYTDSNSGSTLGQHGKQSLSPRDEIRLHGARGSGDIPSKCFGGGGGKSASSSADSSKVIPAVFLAVAFFICMFIAISASPASNQGLEGRPKPNLGANPATNRNFQPSWSR